LPRALQPSAGFRYTWRAAAPLGQHIQSATLDGRELDPAADYRVTVNSFLAEGGDRFSVLTQGRDRIRTVVDVDALEAYFREVGEITSPALGRIVREP
jgi:5'-nucleotidase